MSTPAEEAGTVEAVLAQVARDHMPQAFDCSCGYYPDEDLAGMESDYALADHTAQQQAAALAPVLAAEQQEAERQTSERAWDEGVQWARDEINEFARFSGKHIADQPRMTNAVIQPHYDALDAVPNGLGYSRYNDHIASVAFMSAVDTITPMLDPPPGYEPDDDPNPYRSGEVPEGTITSTGAGR